MFNKSLFLILLVSLHFYAFGQVAINSTGNLPESSAMLDISATDKGLLIPRVSLDSTTDNTTIPSPATGLLVYNMNTINDVSEGFYYYDGSAWSKLGISTSYVFQNGLTSSSNVVGLGGDLLVGTAITLGGNNLQINSDNTGVFSVQSSGVDKTIFMANGNVDFKGFISSGGYYNFSSIFGPSGFGFRERHGNLEYKNDGGDWTAFPEPVSGTSYWWYRPTDSTFIQPQNNNNIRVYDTSETYGLYFNGNKNQYGGFFRTTASFNPTAAVVGYSDVLGNRTKGYLGYNGRWTNTAGDINLDGMALYGEVQDSDRTALFAHTTRDANYAAIIGYSDVWISGYYYTRDEDAYSSSHPALYGQLISGADKTGYQPAIEGWSEYIGGNGNDGYTIGGNFYALGHEQDSRGLLVYAQAYGSNTDAIGAYFNVDSADYIYGIRADVGNSTVAATESYGGYFTNYSTDGSGIMAIASNAQNVYTSGNGDGLIGVSDNGYGVFGQFDDNNGTLTTCGILGYGAKVANYFYHEEYSDDGYDQSVALVERQGTNPGVSYDIGETNQGILSINYNPDSLTFAIKGDLVSQGNGRTGAVMGNDYYAWGALGYEISGGANDYGGYFTSYATGSGKSTEKTSVGIGVYGDLMGGWIRGNLYGLTLKGERYSLYVDGQTITNDVIMNVTDVGETEKVVTYVPTTENPQIFLSGVGELSEGKAAINFDKKYQKLIDPSKDIIVTVTPIGKSNGLYLVDSKATGFVVAENGEGKSNIKFTWIAIAQRKTDTKPAEEVLNVKFDELLDGFMFNENNVNQTAQPLWWNGKLQSTKPLFKKENANPIYINDKNFKKILGPKIQKTVTPKRQKINKP